MTKTDRVMIVIGLIVLSFLHRKINTLNEKIDELISNQETFAVALLILLKEDVNKLDFQTEYESFKDNSDVLGNTMPYEWMTPNHLKLLDAIATVESSGNPEAIGDNGNALGMYQIWNVYWMDAVEHSPEIGGDYEDVFDPEYAESVVLAYWDRYGARCDYTLEGLAKIHNGGPRGHMKDVCAPYWEKVEKVLQNE